MTAEEYRECLGEEMARRCDEWALKHAACPLCGGVDFESVDDPIPPFLDEYQCVHCGWWGEKSDMVPAEPKRENIIDVVE